MNPIQPAASPDQRRRSLPPPGSDPVAINVFVMALLEDAATDNNRVEWELDCVDGLNFYLGNQWGGSAPDAAMVLLTINRIQNCVLSLQAAQAGDQPKITFTAREVGAPDRDQDELVYLNTAIPAGQQIAALEQAEAAMVGEVFDPMEPLDPQTVEWIRQQIAAHEQLAALAAATGQPVPPGLIPAEVLVPVTPYTASEALQTVFDGMWEEADAPFYFAENTLNKNILGVQPTLVEFDDQEKKHLLKNPHPLHFFPDPSESDYARAQHVILLEPMTADEAIGLYPDFADKIREQAATGHLQFPGGRRYSLGYQYDRNHHREMVVIAHCWIRNQPYPMTPEEAVASGQLAWGEVPTGQVEVATDPATGAALPPAPVMRRAVVDPLTGEEVLAELADGDRPGQRVPNPAWPTKRLVRQIRCIGGTTVDDRPCEYQDIPVPWNVNIPRPFSPWGQGEPVRLKGLQQALNRAISAAVTYLEGNACPPEYMPASLAQALEQAIGRARVRPGGVVKVPDAIWNRVQGDIAKLVQTLEARAMPADIWKLIEFLVRMIDTEGNQSDVMQGNAAAGWSGEAIAALQNAAAQVIRGKGMWTEFYLTRLARLMAHAILHRMGPEDWARYLKKWPIQAIAAMRQQLIEIGPNVRVSIKSASGAAAQQERSNIIAAATQGKIPLSPQTAIEALGKDPDVELQQTAEWQRRLPPAPPAAPAAPPSAGTPGAGPAGGAAPSPAA